MGVLYCDLLVASPAAGLSEHLWRSCGVSAASLGLWNMQQRTKRGAVAACNDTTGKRNICQTTPFVMQ